MRVLVVDNHELFRAGLREMLAAIGIVAVEEATSGEQALEIVRQRAPNVVVTELHLTGMSGFEVIRQLSRLAPAVRVLVLTISDRERDVLKSIEAGACGYMLKSASLEELASGIRAVAAGESSLSTKVTAMLLERVRRHDTAPRKPDAIGETLSDRELEVLRLITDGRGNVEIAKALFISPRTVKNHVANILTKIKVENRVQAAVYAVRRHLV